MRWLLVCLLVSLAALLIAAAGMARHIWIAHRRPRRQPEAHIDSAQGSGLDQ